jgi:hypothetical protein
MLNQNTYQTSPVRSKERKTPFHDKDDHPSFSENAHMRGRTGFLAILIVATYQSGK